MSERLRSALLLGLLAFGTPLHAQERAWLERREARLSERLATLTARRAMADSLRFARQARTVVSAGPVTVAYPEWGAEEGRRRLPGLVEEVRGRFGIAIDSLLRDTLYIWIDESEAGDEDRWSDLEWRMGALHGTGSVPRRGEMRLDWVTWVPSAAIEQWGQSLLDPALARWLGPADPRPMVAERRSGALRDLILSVSSRGRPCADGMIQECKLLLEIAEVADPLLESYDSLDHRELVARDEFGKAPGRARCVQGRDLAVCRKILQRPDHRPIQAASASVRQSLFTFAVSRGGEGAWLRLRGATGRPLGDQLSALSGMPLDPLVAAWQQDLRAAHRTTLAGLGTGFLVALFWSVVGSLFFAWRYRWRHV